MTHDFDWSKAPQPWCWIGPEFRDRIAALVGRDPPTRDPKTTVSYVERGKKGGEATRRAREG